MLNTIASALEDIKQGKIIIVVDDEDRENEGDMICASEAATPEIINFMTKEARGLICISLTEERCDELGLNMMVGSNTSTHATPYSIGRFVGLRLHNRYFCSRQIENSASTSKPNYKTRGIGATRPYISLEGTKWRSTA
jgi:3,4-dihydroxy-2-butanone 4-phosphate synthase